MSMTDTSLDVKASEQSLESMQALRAIFDNAAVGIAVFSTHGDWLRVNPKFCDMVGYSSEELLATTLQELTLMDDLPAELNSMQQMLAGKLQTYAMDKRCIHKNGQLIWVNVSVSAAKKQNESIDYFIAVMKSIDRRKIDEAAALERRFQCDAIIGNSPASLSLKTVDGCYALANPTLQRALHLAEKEIIGKSDFELYPKDIAQTFKANDDIVLRTLSRHSIEELVPVDGQLRSYMSHIFPVLDDFGNIRFICRISLDITASKQAQALLAASEARMRQLIDRAPASLAIFDRDMRYLAVSQRWVNDFFPVDAPIMIGKLHYEIFPEITDAWKDVHRRALAGETVQSSEDKFVREDGMAQWLRWEVRPWFEQGDTIGGIFIFSEDITHFKVIEESLRDSEQRFRATFEQAAMGIALLAPDGHWLRVNTKLCEIVGYSNDELMSMTFQDITFADDLQADLTQTNQMLTGERQTFSMEKRYVRKDGQLVWINLTVALVKHPDGTPDYFISVVEDIHERKLARFELDKYKATIEFSDDAIVNKTLDGVITSWNKGAEKIFGYSAEEAIGKPVQFLIPTDRLYEESMILEKISKGQRVEHFDTMRQRKNGELFHVSLSISPIRDGSGKLIGASKIARDITKRKLAEEEVVLEKTKLEAALSSMSDAVFISDVTGHVINFNDAFATFHRFKSKAECLKLLGDYATLMEVYTRKGKRLPVDQWALSCALRGEVASNVECELRRVDTGETWIGSYNYSPIFNTDHEIIGAVVTARDVTAQKTTEAELHLAAAAFETQEGIVITDAKGVVLRVNHAFVDITGYEAGEIIGKNSRILRSRRHNAYFHKAIRAALKKTGVWQGEIWICSKSGATRPTWLSITAVKDEYGESSHYVGSMIDIAERKAAEEKIQNLAYYDPLTNLPNRRLLNDRLSQILASSSRSKLRCAMLLIDLDHFKDINDSMGHLMGDALLTQVAQRLKACLREGDSVARIGGDEFVVLVENLDELEMDAASQAGVIGEKIMTQLNLPFQLGERKYHNTASIGIAMKTDETLDYEMLFKQADIAMYQAKRSGRNALRFFDPKMQEYNDEKALLENDLREALEENQLYLQYQIQVNNVKHPTGVEALVRWKHPKRGDVYPSEFIPMAEETGLILPIGAWVLRTACQQLKAWEAHFATSKLVIAVNVSARQFHQANFVEQLTAMVKHYAISPNLLKLELTESMLIDNVQDAIVKMQLLKEIGIRISLDDFGTGYSSLQYLKLLPLDQLKIDQSFIKDLNRDRGSGAIVSTIIAMARGLKINVIAEGVETEEQRDFLENVGCIHFQGYLFGKPMDINEVEQVISQYFYA